MIQNRRIGMSISKKIRKGKMARKQKERQEKLKKSIIEQLSKALEDPANIELIRLIPEIKNKNGKIFLIKDIINK
jgi:hypothetical protein